MTQKQFSTQFAEMLNLEPDELTSDRTLDSIEGWDSVALLSAMVLIDAELGLTVRPDTLSKARTFGDIIAAVSSKLES